MLPQAKTAQLGKICGGLQELIWDSKSFGMREHLPPDAR